jgi:hypothetical protein
MRVLIFSAMLSEIFHNLIIVHSDICINVRRSSGMLPVIPVNQISNFMKILLVGAELFGADGRTDDQADRQTDMTKLIVAFRNFATRLKTCGVYIDQFVAGFNIFNYDSAGVLNYTL